MLQWPARTDPARPGVLRVGPPEKIDPGPGIHAKYNAGASADGGILAVPDGSFTTLIHWRHLDRRFKLGPQHDVRLAAVSPDGRWVATCSWWPDGKHNSTRIWDTNTGRMVHELPIQGNTSARFSPDSRWLATSNAFYSQLWEVDTWQPGRRFEGTILFSPDCSLVALSSDFGVVRLLEADTGREIARLTGSESASYAPLCFTPDGTKLIVSGAYQREFHVWDLRAIRKQLTEIDLDWNWPEFKPTELRAKNAEFLKVEILPGGPANMDSAKEQNDRQNIERCLRELVADPNNSKVCNELAWIYLTGSAALRDENAALPLAENANRLNDGSASYRNTLALAYYRAARYREAVAVLEENLVKQDDEWLALDLYFLAMSHFRLGGTDLARSYLAWAVRWTMTQRNIRPEYMEELKMFRAEAEELLARGEK